jgi:hypothetical protein
LVLVGLTVIWLLSIRGSFAAEPPSQDIPPYEPTSNYTKQDIRGWTVYVNHRLVEDEKELGQRALQLLDVKLYEIVRAVPGLAVAKLQEIRIWVEFKDRRFPCACYHPSKKWLSANGYNPDKAKAVEIANAATFLDWTAQQPSMVLHELAHGYHDVHLGGYSSQPVAGAYQHAMKEKLYESVLRWDGKTVPAYAQNNAQEYFAELSEAWFGTNDFYPFVRAEVLVHDPEGVKVLRETWGE